MKAFIPTSLDETRHCLANNKSPNGHYHENKTTKGSSRATNVSPPLAFIIGDFNEVPDGAAYELITGGRYSTANNNSCSACSSPKLNGKPETPFKSDEGQHYLDLRRELWLSSTSMSEGGVTKKYIEDTIPTWVEYTTKGRKAVDPPMTLDHIFLLDNDSLALDLGQKSNISSREMEGDQHEKHNARWRIDRFDIVDNEFVLEDGESQEGENDSKYRYSDHRMLVASLTCP